MRLSKRFLYSLIILLLCLTIFIPSHADTVISERSEKLNDIELKIEDIATRKKEIQKQLNDKNLTEEDKTDLTQRLQTLSAQNRDFATLFEQTVLGGIDLTLFETPEHEEVNADLNYNWQQEVIQILQPFFAQMQRATEKARTKDLLIEDNKALENKIAVASLGLETLNSISPEELSPQSLKMLNKVNEEWSDKLKSLEHQKNIVELKLQDLTDNRSFFVRITDNLWSFAKNEGLSLIFAAIASLVSYYFINRLVHIYTAYQHRDRKRALNFKWRFLLLILQAINVLFSIAIFLVILHTSGNIILFGVVVLVIFMLILSFRATIPNYLNRLRIFLNLGQAREGERIIYNDIPWEISKISLSNVYLTNPLLDNGELLVSIDLIEKFYSRETITDELWFPSRKGDYLVLPDKRIVKVIRQTPEAIYLDHEGASILMGTAEFYKLKFSNLSRGYSLTLNMTLEDTPENRLDFATIKAVMPEKIQAAISRADESLANAVKNITISTRQLLSSTATSYQVIVEMSSNSAKSYTLAKAALNNAVIEIARNQDWKLLLTENI